MYILTECSPEGSNFPYKDSLNLDLYREVRKERKRLGLPNINHNIVLENSPLVGKKIKKIETNKIYNIEQVNQQWYAGWYIGLLIENNDSHGFIWVENIDCWNDIVVDSIEENKTKYTILED